MAWGTYTIGNREIAMAKWEAGKTADLWAKGRPIPVVIEAESVAECIDMEIMSEHHHRNSDGSAIIAMHASDWNAIFGEAKPKEKPGALLLRLLRRNAPEWDARRSRADKRYALAKKHEAAARSPASAADLARIAADHMRAMESKAK